jgi:thiamine-phosphate pyrophosphorylase
MPERCLLYYITDRSAFGGDERVRRRRLLDKIGEAAASGIDYIQLREKDLSTRDLESLAREAINVIGENCTASERTCETGTALLINSRTDVALAVSAAGVHLRGDGVSPRDVRRAWRNAAESNLQSLRPEPLIAVSCHSEKDVALAASNGATFAVFGPVFEKRAGGDIIPAGLDGLRPACNAKIPVLALGGITLGNAASCLQAGAAGIAGIRLFQENEIAKIVRTLRR